MCFGKKDHYDPSAEAAKPTAYPPAQPTYAANPNKPFTPPSQPVYAPPPGPPPSQSQPPPPPPAGAAELPAEAPPGPPPGKAELPSPGPPPPGISSSSSSSKPPPQHNWEELVPDTSLFPPPPDLFSGWERSPASNATEAQAEAGKAWCETHALVRPAAALDPAALGALEYGTIRLMAPAGFRGELQPSDGSGGVWTLRTPPSAPDCCIIGYPPLYAVAHHQPSASSHRTHKTIYYEVKLTAASRTDGALALGFAALPYPSFRLPGWHRGSLAVHGDDGHRYVNDMWGGKTFAGPFRQGETLGLGMRFTASSSSSAVRGIDVEIFFTRGGRVEGRWDLHEETDAREDLPVTGLEGLHDLSCAVGVFKDITCEVVFDPTRWLYKGVD